ncbi:hypothetical protein BpHYR1_030072 [Brachionus plicatilis]|uniref:Uncharacterized protein n=1 Tax=Brachionus plicatilis TaxID=10195 RepID=A0A3M7PCW4_BRAPC|nr:hypothetical protein BpHYR1_030072 [Brachionus plicatilis]
MILKTYAQYSTDRDPSIAHQDNLKAFVQTPTADTTPPKFFQSTWFKFYHLIFLSLKSLQKKLANQQHTK